MDCCNEILAAVPPTGILWSSDEAHFHLSGTVNKQNFATGLLKTLENSMHDLFTAQK
jgi:hypothetical protein